MFTGLLGITLPDTNMYFAAPHLPSGLLAVIINIAPILTYIFALSFKQEQFTVSRFVGVLCGIAGILIVIIPKAALPNSKEFFWTISALLSPLCFALAAVYINRTLA